VLRELELRRQLIHASGVLLAPAVEWMYAFFNSWKPPAAALAIALLTGYLISNLHRRGVPLPLLGKLIEGAERERDQEFPGRGALRFLTGALITLLVFRAYPEIVSSGIIVLSLGDSASTLGGVMLGRHKLPYNPGKTVEGSLLGFISAFIGLLLLTHLSIAMAAGSSLAGLLVESLPLGVDDNLTIPLSAGLVIWLWSAWSAPITI